MKKKIEKQIRDALGDRVRSVEVRVSGRNVLIVAQATRSGKNGRSGALSKRCPCSRAIAPAST